MSIKMNHFEKKRGFSKDKCLYQRLFFGQNHQNDHKRKKRKEKKRKKKKKKKPSTKLSYIFERNMFADYTVQLIRNYVSEVSGGKMKS